MSLFTGIVSYWKFDESSGNAHDSTATANTLINTNTVTYSAGKINNGANFVSSSTQGLSKNSATGLPTGSSDRTVNLWVKTTTSSLQAFFSYGTANIDQWFTLYVHSGQDYISLLSDDLNGTKTINDGNWHMITCTSSSKLISLYVDGVFDVSQTKSTINTSGTNMTIGRSVAGDYFNGSVDECGIWSRALLGSEITALWNGGAGLSYTFTPSNGNFLMFF